MSRVYVLEPPTKGKVLLRSTVGDIDIELWSKECPNACRNFVQHCLDGYYDNTIFHRVVSGFIVQGGDPTGTGNGGTSAFTPPFKDEFHSRLRFSRRGLVGVAKSNDQNGSQFFFTLDEAAELDRKHTLFGKIVGNTIFNMLRLADGEVGEDERPVYPHKIISAEVLSNPFPDLFPREDSIKLAYADEQAETSKADGVQSVKSQAIRHFGLLSFGDEAESDAKSISLAKKKIEIKAKSAHDINDPLLLQDRVSIEPFGVSLPKNGEHVQNKETEADREKALKALEVRKQRQIIRKEIGNIRKELQTVIEEDAKKKADLAPSDGSFVAQFNREAVQISQTKEEVNAKKGTGKDRESQTMDLLSKFKRKMDQILQSEGEVSDLPETGILKVLVNHELESVETQQIRAIDANRDDDPDRYDIYDPRNPMNKRRRETVDQPGLGAAASQSGIHRTRFQNNAQRDRK